MNLKELGWNEALENEFSGFESEGLTVGRVSLEHKRMYRVLTENGELVAEISGKLRFNALNRDSFPAVGDWVVISARPNEGKATIHALLTRISKFSRKVAGETTAEQIVATNINTVFLVNALNNDFNLRRIERYLLMAWESGANPVIVLTKADLCNNIDEKVSAIEGIAFGVPIHVCSVKDDKGIKELESYFGIGMTVALLGSSGAGKSTLTNRLLGEEKQLIQTIREGDDRGRHTTTHRELLLLPNGGLIIDTPGMRELQLWESEGAISQSFQDIEEIALLCRFKNCSHCSEPGCAIRTAIDEGLLDSRRYQSYVKLQRELAYLESKTDMKKQLAEREKRKKLTKSVRNKNRY